jgi:hypothetical protein
MSGTTPDVAARLCRALLVHRAAPLPCANPRQPIRTAPAVGLLPPGEFLRREAVTLTGFGEGQITAPQGCHDLRLTLRALLVSVRRRERVDCEPIASPVRAIFRVVLSLHDGALHAVLPATSTPTRVGYSVDGEQSVNAPDTARRAADGVTYRR